MTKYLVIIGVFAALTAGTLPAGDPTADELINYFEDQRIRHEVRHAVRHSDDPAALYFAVTEQNRRDQQQTLALMLQLATQK